MLQSTAQDNHTTGIFSLFGTGTTSDKLRFMSGAAGCVALASLEGSVINRAPLTGFTSVMGYGQASVSSTGIAPLPAGMYGPTWQAGVRGLSSGSATINQVATDYFEWTLSTGAQSAFCIKHVGLY